MTARERNLMEHRWACLYGRVPTNRLEYFMWQHQTGLFCVVVLAFAATIVFAR